MLEKNNVKPENPETTTMRVLDRLCFTWPFTEDMTLKFTLEVNHHLDDSKPFEKKTHLKLLYDVYYVWKMTPGWVHFQGSLHIHLT